MYEFRDPKSPIKKPLTLLRSEVDQQKALLRDIGVTWDAEEVEALLELARSIRQGGVAILRGRELTVVSPERACLLSLALRSAVLEGLLLAREGPCT